MVGLSVVPGLIHFVGFYFLPESPRWLLGKQRIEEARRALSWIRGNADIDKELLGIYETLQEEEKETGHSKSIYHSF